VKALFSDFYVMQFIKRACRADFHANSLATLAVPKHNRRKMKGKKLLPRRGLLMALPNNYQSI
jgi:hypothetical protein